MLPSWRKMGHPSKARSSGLGPRMLRSNLGQTNLGAQVGPEYSSPSSANEWSAVGLAPVKMDSNTVAQLVPSKFFGPPWAQKANLGFQIFYTNWVTNFAGPEITWVLLPKLGLQHSLDHRAWAPTFFGPNWVWAQVGLLDSK